MAKIDDIISAEQNRVESILRAAYEAGKEDAKIEMLRVLAGESTTSSGTDASQSKEVRRRAPKGLAKKLVTRVLMDNVVIGSTPQDIAAAAITDDEKMIAESSIRSELRQGKTDGRYKENGGRWFPLPPKPPARPMPVPPMAPTAARPVQAPTLPPNINQAKSSNDEDDGSDLI